MRQSPEGRESPSDYSQITLPAECAGLRLDAVLARLFPEHSRSRLQGWIKQGLVLVEGAPADAKRKVWGGERVSIDAPPAPSNEAPAQDIPLHTVFEDAALIVIDKPAGLVVHPGHGNERGTLMNALLHHAPALAAVPRAGIVHRLDKDTSGLMVVAKTPMAQTHLVRQLADRQVQRHYLALVHGRLAADGVVDAPIGRHPVQRIKMAIVKSGGKPARTHYRVRERFAHATLIECRLETGRTHQIRVHLASIGHPLVGDPVYGRKKCGDERLDTFPRQALHAFRLVLRHPETAAEMGWESPLPEDFATLLESLRNG